MSNAARRDAPPGSYVANHTAGTLETAMVSRRLRYRSERLVLARERNRMVVEHLLHAGHVGADQQLAANHQRLVAIANVVRPQRELCSTRRRDDEDRVRR